MNRQQHLALFHLGVVKQAVAAERKVRFAIIDTCVTPTGNGGHIAMRAVYKAKAEAGFQARILEAENAILAAA